ncbi:MAG: heparinase II/III family protein [Verrucomicrobia bacterium]|nr:heparinase II/III family protein [Verrucomicrobiota bacterium]
MKYQTPSALAHGCLVFVLQSVLVVSVLPVVLTAQASRSVQVPSLRSHYLDELPGLLESLGAWHPFPRAAERKAWETLAHDVRDELISDAEPFLGEEWPQLPATLFLEFFRTGNKRPYDQVNENRRDRLRRLVLAECAEGRGRFLDDIINGIWAMCEQSYWGNSATTFLQAPFEDQVKLNGLRRLAEIRTTLPDTSNPGVDLRSGEFVALFAWTDYLLGPELDAVSPMIRKRIAFEADRRMLTPCLERDFLWMEGRGNWTTWITSNWLTGVLLLEQDDDRRLAALEKLFGSLDYFFSQYQPDGACHEGPSYWRKTAGSLFEALELLNSASGGKFDLFDEALVQKMAQYIYQVHIAENYFMNFSDSPGRIEMPAELIIRYGRRIDDPNLVALGRSLLAYERSWGDHSLQRDLTALFLTPLDVNSGESDNPPLLRDAWVSSMQVMAARDVAGTTKGLFLGAKAGSNGEGHNHNDTGNFVIFADGKPVLIDVGPIAYTATNSSPDRYSIWTMQSAYHNLPTINGIMQKEGRTHAASDVIYRTEDTFARLTMDLSDAYPLEAGVVSWKRILTLNRGQDVTLSEHYVLNRDVSEITLSLMTTCDVRKVADGVLLLSGDGMTSAIEVRFDSQKLKPILEAIPISDGGLVAVWGSEITRILLKVIKPSKQDDWLIQFVPENRRDENSH